MIKILINLLIIGVIFIFAFNNLLLILVKKLILLKSHLKTLLLILIINGYFIYFNY